MNDRSNLERRFWRAHRASHGQSAVELALITPVLVLVLLLGMDFGRMFFAAVAVSNAARAGAQYGSQSLITAADAAGMQSAAAADAGSISGWQTPTAGQCYCGTATGVPSCTFTCSTSGTTFVQVDTSAQFTTFASYPGFPNPVTLRGRAIMKVQQ